MKQSTKKYVGLFLLLIFLYPFVEKGIHDFEHRNDFHCSTKSEKHLHEIAHSCAVCDFTVPISNHPLANKVKAILIETTFFYSNYISSIVLYGAEYTLSPRAPPLV